MPKTVKIASASELSPGQCKVVSAEGTEVALFNVDGKFYATDNVCLHKGGPLGDGSLDGPIVTCPWHGWQYDVTNGSNTSNPELRVKTLKVSVNGTDVLVEI